LEINRPKEIYSTSTMPENYCLNLTKNLFGF